MPATAMIISQHQDVGEQLQMPTAQKLIDKGARLYLNGSASVLSVRPIPGWTSCAVLIKPEALCAA